MWRVTSFLSWNSLRIWECIQNCNCRRSLHVLKPRDAMTKMAPSYAREYEKMREKKMVIMTQRVRLKHSWWYIRSISIRIFLMFMAEKKLLKIELQEMQHFTFPTLKFMFSQFIMLCKWIHGTNLWIINLCRKK